MSDIGRNGGPAFAHGNPEQGGDPGMSLRDWFAGQALSNPAICTGTAQYQYEIDAWFGPGCTGITRYQIAAAQAGDYADAMLAERGKS